MRRSQIRLVSLVAGFLVSLPSVSLAQVSRALPSDEIAASILGIHVEIQGPSVRQTLGGWSSADGGAQVIPVSTSTVAGDQYTSSVLQGRKVEELTLSRHVFTGGNELLSMLNDALRGVSTTAVSVTDRREDSSPGVRRDFLDAFPVSYAFPFFQYGDGSFRESLTVQPTRVEISHEIVTGAAEAGRPIPEGSFDVEGLPGESNDRVRSIFVDNLQFDLIESTDRSGTTLSLGQPHFGTMTVTVLQSGQPSELLEWWQDSADGQQERRVIDVSVIDPMGGVARTYRFFDCVPFSHQFVSAEGPAVEEVRLLIGRVEFLF